MRAIVLIVSLFAVLPASALDNQLKNHPSPYLALHGTDATAWQEWNAQTIERARQENKLLLVSIGYFACHWCHVMQRESFKNPEIARLLNDRFIPVKVDREIHGALDAELQAFAEATRGQAGWPLNVFVTPEGYPLLAVLYLPPEEFSQTLSRLAERWQRDAVQLKQLAQAAAQEMPAPQVVEAKFAPPVGVHYRKRLVEEALAQADLLLGGFGKVNKFPQYPQLAALLAAQQAEPNGKLAEFLRLTLDQMASQGLFDHVGGGFYRYTVDPDWHIPHFEKMLYDNAQLARLYLHAAKVFAQPEYRAVAFSALDFMLEEMRDAKRGAFITSTSAIDDQDREGGYYLWHKDELAQVLEPAELALVTRIWRLDLPPDLDDGYLPMHKAKPSAAERAQLAAIHAKLKQARAQRVLPKDDKLISGLNGLALTALSEAAALEPRYREAAKVTRDFLVGRMLRPEGLLKGEAKGKPLGLADLEDYVYVAEGLLAYAKLTGGNVDRELARKLVETAWRKFHTARGWQLEQKPLLARPYYQVVVADSPSQAPSAVLIKLSWELGGKDLRTHALKGLNVGYAILDQGVFWYATQVLAMNALSRAP